MKLTNLLFEQINKDPQHIEVLATQFGKVYGIKFDGQQVNVPQALDYIKLKAGKELPTRNLDSSKDFPIIKNVLEDQGIEIEIVIGGSLKGNLDEQTQFAVPQLYNELRKHISLTVQPAGASDFDKTFPSLKSFADFIVQKNIQITTGAISEQSDDPIKIVATYDNYGSFYSLHIGDSKIRSFKEASQFVEDTIGYKLPDRAMYSDPIFNKFEEAFEDKGYEFDVYEIDVD